MYESWINIAGLAYTIRCRGRSVIHLGLPVGANGKKPLYKKNNGDDGWYRYPGGELVKIAIGGDGEVSGIGEFGGIFSRNA